MFKDFLKGKLSNLFTFKNIIIFIVFVVLLWALYSYSGSKYNITDLMSDGTTDVSDSNPTDQTIRKTNIIL